MAGNVTSIQVMEDGPRNVVIKYEGILDTSDIAATGQIGASGFTTTIGSPNITFVAGALLPTVGQYVTFSDSTTTFPANTYIISITDATHIVVSANALAANVAAAITITGTAGAVVILDPSKLSTLDPCGNPQQVCTTLSIAKIMHNIEDSLSVNLFWEATANQRVEELVGRGKMDYFKYGNIANNAGTGKTGKLVATTQGWAASGLLSFSLIIHCIKS